VTAGNRPAFKKGEKMVEAEWKSDYESDYESDE
jgi:hypothetical protein